MKRGLSTVVLAMLMLAFSSLSAQLFIGPNIQGGMTYSKNFIIEDTSKYWIGSSPSSFLAGGLDFAYQFDKNVRVQAGVQGQYRSFKLNAPDGVTGLTFSEIKKNVVVVAIPVTVNYRLPFGSTGNRFFNIMAGHSLDFTFADSVTTREPILTPVDSGGSFIHHEYQVLTKKHPISSVILGVGVDLVTPNKNIFNVSLTWGISTRTLFRGSVQEWEVLHQDYNAQTTTTDPEEFPDHYYEWALRGSNLSVRASYYFNLKSAKERKESKLKEEEGTEENAETPSKKPSSKKSKLDKEEEELSSEGTKAKPPKAAKPDKEKAEKPEKTAKEKAEKPAKEKKPKKSKLDEEEEAQ